MPLLCQFGIFGLKGIRPFNQPKRLLDCAACLEPVEDMRIGSTKVFCCLFDIGKLLALNLNGNSSGAPGVTWTRH